MNKAADCFALLDDSRSTTASSRLYQHLDHHLISKHADDLPAFFNHIELQTQQGLYVVVLWSYEMGEVLHHITSPQTEQPLAQALFFKTCRHLSKKELDQWLDMQSHHQMPASVLNIKTSVTHDTFISCIARIQSYIAAGDTYQVNYTFRLLFQLAGSPLLFYQQLRQRQPVPYGALIQLPDDRIVVSLSPELFIRHEDGQLLARPMKGTAKTHPDPQTNLNIQQQLQHDPKNQAENVMIVDLLRNDLGSIATAGSVQVPDLFTVTQYGQVWQMTSTVKATCKPGLSLFDLVRAVYPCGSITGAPKHRTMQIIRDIEDTPRQLYTGAIGWIDPVSSAKTLPDFCLSVPIRTALLSPAKQGIRQAQMGIGAGIVYDSDAQSEYEECLLKGQFLSEIAMDIGLIETIYTTREQGYRHLSRHIARLKHSAAVLGIPFSASQLDLLLIQHQVTLLPKTPYKVRVLLSKDGAVSLTSAPLQISRTPVTVFLAETPVTSSPLLAHKTTDRALYNATLERAVAKGGFDALFFNHNNELTEGCRSNVFARIKGQWCTPPVSAGLLPGVMRQCILEDALWQAKEQIITRDELLNSTQIMVCNALHGPLFVHLDRDTVL